MAAGETALGAKMTRTPGKLGMLGFAVVLLIGVTYAGFHLLSDLSVEHGAQPGNGLGAHRCPHRWFWPAFCFGRFAGCSRSQLARCRIRSRLQCVGAVAGADVAGFAPKSTFGATRDPSEAWKYAEFSLYPAKPAYRLLGNFSR